MTFIAGHESAEVLQPREEAFDLPAAAVAAQLASVLRLPATAPVRRDHLHVPLGRQARIELVGVVRLVADQPRRRRGQELRVERLFDEGDFAGARTCDSNGERKTTAVCDCHDLGPLPAPRGADAGAPFFAPA